MNRIQVWTDNDLVEFCSSSLPQDDDTTRWFDYEIQDNGRLNIFACYLFPPRPYAGRKLKTVFAPGAWSRVDIFED